jgi:CapZ-interacting protein
MGILDDAIKEHLELKRQHGAGETELKQLEDEAFGASERPGGDGSAADSLAEAPTQFMSQPDLAEAPAPEAGEQPPADDAPADRRPRAELADLQEPPPPPAPEPAAEPETGAEPEPETEEPAEEQSPAMEHEVPPGPDTEERHAIAEQPTEMYDVEEELAGTEPPAPSEEELIEEEISEPRLAPVDPLSGIDEVEEADETETDADDFFDEKRLSDELDQALEAPAEPEAAAEEPGEEEAEYEDAAPTAGPDEDVLEETPDFLEETPEDDQLWFEQKPPKDFDFDD